MNQKTLIIIAAVIVLLILGVVGFVQFSKSSKVAPGAVVTEDNSPAANSETTKGTIQGLLSAGKNVTCTMSYPDQSGTGTIYVSGNKFRGDFNVKVSDKQMVSHMIQDNGTAYMWTEGSNQGTSFKIDAVKPSIAPNSQTQTADLNKEVDLKCTPGSGDASQFTPPSTIKFTDMSAMMKNAAGASGAGSVPKMDASVCNAVTDPAAKAQCLKALGQ